jgi:hypothetical protein
VRYNSYPIFFVNHSNCTALSQYPDTLLHQLRINQDLLLLAETFHDVASFSLYADLGFSGSLSVAQLIEFFVRPSSLFEGLLFILWQDLHLLSSACFLDTFHASLVAYENVKFSEGNSLTKYTSNFAVISSKR